MTFIVKLTHQDHTRKLSFPQQPSWDILASKIEELYRFTRESITVSYVDGDNDEVELNTDGELADYFRHFLRKGETARFHVNGLPVPLNPSFETPSQVHAQFDLAGKTIPDAYNLSPGAVPVPPSEAGVAPNDHDDGAHSTGSEEWQDIGDEKNAPFDVRSEVFWRGIEEIFQPTTLLGGGTANGARPRSTFGQPYYGADNGFIPVVPRNPDILLDVRTLSPRSTATLIKVLDEPEDSDDDADVPRGQGPAAKAPKPRLSGDLEGLEDLRISEAGSVRGSEADPRSIEVHPPPIPPFVVLDGGIPEERRPIPITIEHRYVPSPVPHHTFDEGVGPASEFGDHPDPPVPTVPIARNLAAGTQQASNIVTEISALISAVQTVFSNQPELGTNLRRWLRSSIETNLEAANSAQAAHADAAAGGSAAEEPVIVNVEPPTATATASVYDDRASQVAPEEAPPPQPIPTPSSIEAARARERAIDAVARALDPAALDNAFEVAAMATSAQSGRPISSQLQSVLNSLKETIAAAQERAGTSRAGSVVASPVNEAPQPIPVYASVAAGASVRARSNTNATSTATSPTERTASPPPGHRGHRGHRHREHGHGHDHDHRGQGRRHGRHSHHHDHEEDSDYTTRHAPGTSHAHPQYYPPPFPPQQTGLITVPAVLAQPPPPGTPVGVWITRPSADPAHPAPLLYYQPFTGHYGGVPQPPIVPPTPPSLGIVGPPALTSVAVQAQPGSVSHRSSMRSIASVPFLGKAAAPPSIKPITPTRVASPIVPPIDVSPAPRSTRSLAGSVAGSEPDPSYGELVPARQVVEAVQTDEIIDEREAAIRSMTERKTQLEIAKANYRLEKQKWKEEKEARRAARDREIERLTGRRVLSHEEQEQRRLIEQADLAAAAINADRGSQGDISPARTPRNVPIIPDDRQSPQPQVYSLLGSAALNSSNPADMRPPANLNIDTMGVGSPRDRRERAERPDTFGSFPPPYAVPRSRKSPSTAGGNGKAYNGGNGYGAKSRGGTSVGDAMSPRYYANTLDGDRDVKPGSAAAQAMQVERLTDKLDEMGFSPGTNPRFIEIIRSAVADSPGLNDDELLPKVFGLIVSAAPSGSRVHRTNI